MVTYRLMAGCAIVSSATGPVATFDPARGQWKPVEPMYDQTTFTQITTVGREWVASRANCSTDEVKAVEDKANAERQQRLADRARLEQADRDEWRRMSEDDRRSLDDYAMKTEGHTT